MTFLVPVEIITFPMQVVLGTLLAALVPVVGFNAVMTSEHFASFLVSVYQLSFITNFSFLILELVLTMGCLLT